MNRFSGTRRLAARQAEPNYKKPFWLPAVSYYILATAIVIAVFFIVWWLLQDPTGGTPWIPAGILSSALLIGAVFLREIVLREARNRHLLAQRRLDSNLNVPARPRPPAKNKLSLTRNEKILSEIETKSRAAQTLKQVSDAHLEVFEICDEYLLITGKEMRRITPGSPRLGAIRKGRRRAKKLHRFHLLAWAALESQFYTREASKCDTIDERIEKSDSALTVLKTALEYYPDEAKLVESANVVKELMVSTQISEHVESAEASIEKRDYKSAIRSYNDALFFLARDDVRTNDTDELARKINAEIMRLRKS